MLIGDGLTLEVFHKSSFSSNLIFSIKIDFEKMKEVGEFESNYIFYSLQEHVLDWYTSSHLNGSYYCQVHGLKDDDLTGLEATPGVQITSHKPKTILECLFNCLRKLQAEHTLQSPI